jgi:hypothetical protein
MDDLEPTKRQPFWGPNAKMIAFQFAFAFIVANTLFWLAGGSKGWLYQLIDRYLTF